MKLLPLLGECPAPLVSEVAYTYREWDFSEVELTCQGHMAKSPMRIDADLLRMFFSRAFQLGNSIFSAQGQSPANPQVSDFELSSKLPTSLRNLGNQNI